MLYNATQYMAIPLGKEFIVYQNLNLTSVYKKMYKRFVINLLNKFKHN